MYEVIEVLRKVCERLEQFCDGEGIDAEKIEVINSLYTNIESSDYAGKFDLKYVDNICKHLSINVLRDKANILLFTQDHIHTQMMKTSLRNSDS